MKRLIFLLLPLFSFLTTSAQTDTIPLSPQQFGNSVLTNLWENPAYSGAEQRHNINLNYQKRWPWVPQTKRYLISYDLALGKNKRLGLGIYYSHYLAGATTKKSFNISGSYKFLINKKHKLRLGSSISYLIKSVNFRSLTYEDMIDPCYGFSYGTEETQVTSTSGNLEVGSGIWYTIYNYYLGLSVLHINQPKNGIIVWDQSRLPRDYYITSGYDFKISDYFSILPSFLLKKSYGYFTISPSVLCIFRKNYIVGFIFKDLNTICINTGVLFLKKFRFMITYGVPAHEHLRQISEIGYIEYSLRFQFGKSVKNE
ncbi:MAG: PorP/SprF family type IX secretion system membrane protein [Bacteroidota bacterium]